MRRPSVLDASRQPKLEESPVVEPSRPVDNAADPGLSTTMTIHPIVGMTGALDFLPEAKQTVSASLPYWLYERICRKYVAKEYILRATKELPGAIELVKASVALARLRTGGGTNMSLGARLSASEAAPINDAIQLMLTINPRTKVSSAVGAAVLLQAIRDGFLTVPEK